MIDRFQNEYRWLSNFWLAPVTFEGTTYPSVEHAYVAAKTLDENIRAQVRGLRRPGAAKRFGRKISLRPDWEDVKLSVMETLLRSKFEHPYLRRLLDSTGDQMLVEGNDWGDTFWGMTPAVHPGMPPWTGENHLGKLLMKIRNELRG